MDSPRLTLQAWAKEAKVGDIVMLADWDGSIAKVLAAWRDPATHPLRVWMQPLTSVARCSSECVLRGKVEHGVPLVTVMPALLRSSTTVSL